MPCYSKSRKKKTILNKAKAILLGGAAVNHALTAQLQHIHAPVYHTYGMTETISHIALRLLNTSHKQDYFTVLEGVAITTDSTNCLVIHTPVLDKNPVVTNDVVELLSPTTFIWKGRIDNMINTGGIKVQAEKVEQAVEQALHLLKIQRRFFVAGFPHPQLGEAVTLFLEGAILSADQKDLLQQKIAEMVHRYERPQSIICLSVFQETPTGKINKKESIRLFLEKQQI